MDTMKKIIRNKILRHFSVRALYTCAICYVYILLLNWQQDVHADHLYLVPGSEVDNVNKSVSVTQISSSSI